MLYPCPLRRRRANDECRQARPSMLQRSKMPPLALAKLQRAGKPTAREDRRVLRQGGQAAGQGPDADPRGPTSHRNWPEWCLRSSLQRAAHWASIKAIHSPQGVHQAEVFSDTANLCAVLKSGGAAADMKHVGGTRPTRKCI